MGQCRGVVAVSISVGVCVGIGVCVCVCVATAAHEVTVGARSHAEIVHAALVEGCGCRSCRLVSVSRMRVTVRSTQG